MENNQNSHWHTIPKASDKWIKRKKLSARIAGVILILFSSFLLFAVWISRTGDHETPLYVYLALTFSFGLLILCGIWLILSAKKYNTDIHMIEIPLQNINTIAQSNIYYFDEHLEPKGDYGSISPWACASAWYKIHHEPTVFSFIKRAGNRYIGNRAWLPGYTSYISLCDGRNMVKFTINPPSDTTSQEYLTAREKWEEATRKIYAAGWMLFDET